MKVQSKIIMVTVLCFVAGLGFPSCTEDEPTNWEGVGVLDCEAEPVSPAYNDTIYADSVIVEWSYTATGDCDESPTFQAMMRIGPQMDHFDQDMTTHDSTTFRDLLSDTAYYWYVITRDADYDSSVSDTFCFYIGNLEFGLPLDPSPADGATEVSLHPDLEWSVHNPLGETYRFDVYFGQTNDPPLVQTDLADAICDPGALQEGTTYFWKVAAFTADNDTTWGPVWQFTTSDIVSIYGLFEVDGYIQSEYVQYIDLRARFDSVYAPTEPIDPITSYTVAFILPDETSLPLTLNPSISTYVRFEMSDPFLVPGESYEFSVTRTPDVFGLTLPDCVPSIISPASLSQRPNNGFEVTWTGTECGGYVWITILKYSSMGMPDSANVWVNTENDGSYTLTAEDLADLEPSYLNMYDVIVIKQDEIAINAAGWLEQSMIRIRIYDKAESVYLVDP